MVEPVEAVERDSVGAESERSREVRSSCGNVGISCVEGAAMLQKLTWQFILSSQLMSRDDRDAASGNS